MAKALAMASAEGIKLHPMTVVGHEIKSIAELVRNVLTFELFSLYFCLLWV